MGDHLDPDGFLVRGGAFGGYVAHGQALHALRHPARQLRRQSAAHRQASDGEALRRGGQKTGDDRPMRIITPVIGDHQPPTHPEDTPLRLIKLGGAGQAGDQNKRLARGVTSPKD